MKYCGNHERYLNSRVRRILAVPIFTTIMLLFILPFAFDQANAAQYNAIGLIIETSCKISSNCLDIKDIISLDNSNKIYTGSFYEKDGDFIRKCTSKQNNFNWLQFEKNYTILVDPCLGYQSKIKTITIISKLDEFHNKDQMTVYESGKPDNLKDSKAIYKTRSFSHTRDIDTSCTHATITAKNWKFVLPDTIRYMMNNCDPSSTKIKTVDLEVKTLAKHNLAESLDYKTKQAKEYVIKNCLKSFGKCDPPNPSTTERNEPMKPKTQTTLTKTNKQHHVIVLVE